MDSDALKAEIQQAYRDFLRQKNINPRTGQRLMIAELVRNLLAIERDEENQRQCDSHVSVIEAATGTGKTLAYLLGVLPTAKWLEKKVVLATATVALQDQVLTKDIPEVLAHTNLEFSYTLAKGRGRYLCPSKLHQLLHPEQQGATMALWEDYQNLTLDASEVKRFQALEQAWSKQQWDGDRDSWPEVLEDRHWFRLVNDHRGCTGRNCSYYDDCPFYIARADIHRCDLIVANHDLVLADLAMGGGVILPTPESTIYLFDEGHHLPEKAINHFAAGCQLFSSQNWLKEMPKLMESLQQQSGEASMVAQQMPRISQLCRDIGEQLAGLARSLLPLYDEQAGAESSPQAVTRYRFENGVVPSHVQQCADQLREITHELGTVLNLVNEWLQDGLEDKRPDITRADAESWLPVTTIQRARAEAMESLWRYFAQEDGAGKAPTARWLNFSESVQGVDVEMAASPILACDVLVQHLWQRAFAAVITSATLSVAESFDRFQLRAGTPAQSHFCILPSAFRYQQVGRIRIPRFACDPANEAQHTQQVIAFLDQLNHVAEGTLVLFNSRRQMEAVYEGVAPVTQALVMTQGQLGKRELVATHKNKIDEGASSILFGLASLAEGVDLPGNYCKRVVIVRLPFTVPEDPVDATLAEWVKQKQGNPFIQLTVPDAAIRLKQAVGRLIRTEQDQGEVVILDRRIIDKRYGKILLSSLPPFPVIVESI